MWWIIDVFHEERLGPYRTKKEAKPDEKLVKVIANAFLQDTSNVGILKENEIQEYLTFSIITIEKVKERIKAKGWGGEV